MIRLPYLSKRLLQSQLNQNQHLFCPLIKRNLFNIFKKSSQPNKDEDLFDSLKNSSQQVNSSTSKSSTQDFGMSASELQNMMQQAKESQSVKENKGQQFGMTSQELQDMFSQVKESKESWKQSDSFFSNTTSKQKSNDIDIKDLLGNRSDNKAKENITINDFQTMSSSSNKSSSFSSSSGVVSKQRQTKENNNSMGMNDFYTMSGQSSQQVKSSNKDIDINELLNDNNNKTKNTSSNTKSKSDDMSINDFKVMNEQANNAKQTKQYTNPVEKSFVESKETVSKNKEKQNEIRSNQQANMQLIHTILRLVMHLVQNMLERYEENRRLNKDVQYLEQSKSIKSLHELQTQSYLLEKDQQIKIRKDLSSLTAQEIDACYETLINSKHNTIKNNKLIIKFYQAIIGLSILIIIYIAGKSAQLEQEHSNLEIQNNQVQ